MAPGSFLTDYPALPLSACPNALVMLLETAHDSLSVMYTQHSSEQSTRVLCREPGSREDLPGSVVLHSYCRITPLVIHSAPHCPLLLA